METMADLLTTGLSAHPDATAVHDGQRRLTFRELEARATAAATILNSRYGVRSGDRVAVKVPKSIDIVTAALAIWKAGAIYVPLDPANGPGRTQYILDAIEPAVVIGSDSGTADQAVPCVWRSLAIETLADVRPETEGVPLPRPSGGDIGMIIHTSGSTGKPKGVQLSTPAR